MRKAGAMILAALMALVGPCGALASSQDAVTPDQAQALTQRRDRALLIGIDAFVTKPSAYPSATNNVQAIREVFGASATPFASLVIPTEPVTSCEDLTRAIRSAFADAQENDVSYLYISTHGLYDPVTGEASLLLSDGWEEGSITPAQLEAAFEGIAGTKVLWLDACNSGAFIGKGLTRLPDELHFLGDEFKVITSSGALEESWYWSADAAGDSQVSAREPQGGFYFTQALSHGLSARHDYPADTNKDGSITQNELYDYLLLNHAASTPQVYPQNDDFVVFRYDTSQPLPKGVDRSPISDVTFSGTILSAASPSISIEFIALRPVRVAYQIVYQRDGKWMFDQAQLIYDQAERFTAFGDLPGAVSAGHKVRALSLGELEAGSSGYVLVQLVTIDEGALTVHAGRVICVPPEGTEVSVSVAVDAAYTPGEGRELSVFVAHSAPCALSVAVVDAQDQVLARLCHRQSTRPMQLDPEGTVLYWDGTLRDGQTVPAGTYYVRAEAIVNDTSVTAYSEAFEVLQPKGGSA